MKNRKRILDLKPTQFAVGMLEVDEKIKMVQKLSNKELRAFVNESPVPVILAPNGNFYVVDHHHFLCVCYHVGIQKVKIEIVQDLSTKKMTYTKFWNWMFKTRNAYPFCQFGEGPRKALYLPRDIRGLADDPYRSLAWFVRKAGAFENTDKNFAEFEWANYFRKCGLLDKQGLDGMPKALIKAAKLAQTNAAKHLPGFEKLATKATTEVIKKIKTKGKAVKKIIGTKKRSMSFEQT